MKKEHKHKIRAWCEKPSFPSSPSLLLTCSLNRWNLSHVPLFHPSCLELNPPGLLSPFVPSRRPLFLYLLFLICVTWRLWVLDFAGRGDPGRFLDQLSPPVSSLSFPDSGSGVSPPPRQCPCCQVTLGHSCTRSILTERLLCAGCCKTTLSKPFQPQCGAYPDLGGSIQRARVSGTERAQRTPRGTGLR